MSIIQQILIINSPKNLFSSILSTITLTTILIFIPYWIYTSLAWKKILKDLKAKNLWLAWIPFARKALILHTTKRFSWKQMFFLLIPIIGWLYVELITKWTIWIAFKKRNYPGWPILIPLITWIPFTSKIPGYIAIIGFLIFLGFVAWKNKQS